MLLRNINNLDQLLEHFAEEKIGVDKNNILPFPTNNQQELEGYEELEEGTYEQKQEEIINYLRDNSPSHIQDTENYTYSSSFSTIEIPVGEEFLEKGGDSKNYQVWRFINNLFDEQIPFNLDDSNTNETDPFPVFHHEVYKNGVILLEVVDPFGYDYVFQIDDKMYFTRRQFRKTKIGNIQKFGQLVDLLNMLSKNKNSVVLLDNIKFSSINNMDDLILKKENRMKINSNTIVLAKDSDLYKELETVITKIADANKIGNVRIASVALSQQQGLVTFKLASDPYLEEGLYKGSLSQQELLDLKNTLTEDAAYVPVGSEQEKMLNEQLGMINEQLGAVEGIDRVNLQDPFSFAPEMQPESQQGYASNAEEIKKVAEMFDKSEEK